MQLVESFITGACGATLVTGLVTLIKFFVNRKDQKDSNGAQQNKALRYIMLYIIQERARQHLKDGHISLNERRCLHHWHDLYHNGLGGNGDATALMGQIDQLPLNTND